MICGIPVLCGNGIFMPIAQTSHTLQTDNPFLSY